MSLPTKWLSYAAFSSLLSGLCLVSQAQTFSPASVVSSTANGTFGLEAADLNGDSHVDVISAERGSDQINYYPGFGTGSFGAAVNIGISASDVRNVFPADLDGDGDMDVAASLFGSNRHVWYANDGSGNFSGASVIVTGSGAIDLAAADMDLDGDIDIVSCNLNDDDVDLSLNNGSGSFTSSLVSTTQNGPRSVAIAELNGDSLPDILVASRNDNTVAWYANLGGGVFGPEQNVAVAFPEAFSVFPADFDQDGLMDVLATANLAGDVTWFRNLGGGVFDLGNAVDGLISSVVAAIALDADLDGFPDVAAIGRGGGERLKYYPNDGAGAFAIGETLFTGFNGVIGIASADFNEDGFPDIVAGSEFDDAIRYFENTTTIIPACPVPTALMAAPTSSSVTVSWTGSPNHLGYLIQGRTLGATAFRNGITVDTFRNIAALFPGTTYEWRLKARCLDGTVSDLTALESFTTGVLRTESDVEAARWLMSGDKLVLSGIPDNTTIRLVDVQGRVLRQNTATTGHTVVWSRNGLAAGIYLAVWETEQGQSTLRMALP